eukprot:Gb_28162 [translate_table: standard]
MVSEANILCTLFGFKMSYLRIYTALIALAIVTVSICPCNCNHGLDTKLAATRVCSQTPYPDVCVSTLAGSSGWFKGGRGIGPAKITVKASMGEVSKASAFAAKISRQTMAEIDRIALQDCIELLDRTSDMLSDTLSGLQAAKETFRGDLTTWLSAGVTNQDTCIDGFQNSNGFLKPLMHRRVENVSKSVSNSLAMVKAISSVNGVSQAGITDSTHSRRLLTETNSFSKEIENGDGFPSWMPAADRKLLQSPEKAVQAANTVVAQDGSGNYKTITDAVNAAPEKSSSRYVIHVKAGTYRENVVVSKKKTNLMFIGDGTDVTVVSGSKSVGGGTTTFRSATFGAVGKGFIAQNMTFENTAGPGEHQAVALRVGSDLSALYQCSFKGYQDTLYTHSLRQFYRDCNIYGTVDFIFGNAAVVLQNCNIYARKPLSKQKNTITAQGRTDPNQNTGISIQNCRVTAASDLVPFKSSFQTYLGRPYKQYSRTVYLKSFLDDLIDPAGWLEWSGDFALSTLYYGEYMNTGPGAGTSKRVKWPGYRVINSSNEASKFTVSGLISGDLWLPSTGITFTSGLN